MYMCIYKIYIYIYVHIIYLILCAHTHAQAFWTMLMMSTRVKESSSMHTERIVLFIVAESAPTARCGLSENRYACDWFLSGRR